ncbi:unnamed protein product [Soboliphyme baturini]|uniref:Cytochrome c oxidase assembly protein COX11, mitochondrial n=1 Tax=Soboliphyme baturini TaxID=241478 RepID=A0A183J7S9_9BILA|nr:unnamed protein product [Soboliphyme baturini]
MLIRRLFLCSQCLAQKFLHFRYFGTSFSRGHVVRPLLHYRRQLCSSSGSSQADQVSAKRRSIAMYAIGGSALFVSITFAAVPAYKVFCQKTGLGGDSRTILRQSEDIQHLTVVKDRLIKVQFAADVNSRMAWNFKPLQDEIFVHPGETALAFYSALNPTDVPIVGIATYNIVPFDAALYFCFCFEEQILNPKEEVDLPVFFYIDPEYAEDPKLEDVDNIVLNYTFFESQEGLNLSLPDFESNRDR